MFGRFMPAFAKTHQIPALPVRAMFCPTSSPFFPIGLFSLETADFDVFTGARKVVFIIGGKGNFCVHNHVLGSENVIKYLISSYIGLWKRLITVFGTKWEVW